MTMAPEEISITPSMIAQESELEKENEVVPAEQSLDLVDESTRNARLNFLIAKSKIYTSILAKKLSEQQAMSKSRGDILDGSKNTSSSNENAVEQHLPGEKTKNMPPSRTRSRKSRQAQSSKNDRLQQRTQPSISSRQPALVTGGYMREYQLAGLEWMISLYENGLNGILADEMGLGKTLQAIAFLAFLRGKGVLGPFLIAAPLSTLANWVNEIHRFAPSIPVVLYHGDKNERAILRSRIGTIDEDFPIVVTSYEIIINDRVFLAKYHWKYIVVDEGHRLKNMNCKLIKELKSYKSANRLLLTGTPLQNNLAELWSLLNFLLPDIFSDLDAFQSWFNLSSFDNDDKNDTATKETSAHNHIITTLHQILKPFLLRRLKDDVERDLPKKREYLLYAPMMKTQGELYKAILAKKTREYLQNGKASSLSRKRNIADDDHNDDEESKGPRRKSRRSSVQELSDTSTEVSSSGGTDSNPLEAAQLSTKHLKLRNVLMTLRQACNHPYQVNWPVVPGTDELLVGDELTNLSGKMLLLRTLLLSLLPQHKVLIFSQFTSMLDILEIWCEDIMKLRIARIDGNVKQEARRSLIRDFNEEEECQVFLLSTRAGGLGINLTAADTVILFDSDWNPQADIQAMDRVHRIGQKKPVLIYRLVSRDTIESKILEKANYKRKLEKAVIKKGEFQSLVSTNSRPDKDTAIFLEMLMKDDLTRITVKNENEDVISPEDLALILDRSDEAYAKHGKEQSSFFESISLPDLGGRDTLATIA